jgi:hypothetical protein
MISFPWSRFGGERAGAPFHYPAGEPPVTVVLSRGFAPSRLVRPVPEATSLGPLDAAVEALAGTMEQLRRAAMRGVVVSRGIVVFTYEGGAPLVEEEREYLWERFGVPVFEQYLSSGQELLATECDAHEGLHLMPGAGARAGYAIEFSACACGDARPRYVPLPEREFAAAAFSTSAVTA